jgi:hypothetical protein
MGIFQIPGRLFAAEFSNNSYIGRMVLSPYGGTSIFGYWSAMRPLQWTDKAPIPL